MKNALFIEHFLLSFILPCMWAWMPLFLFPTRKYTACQNVFFIATYLWMSTPKTVICSPWRQQLGINVAAFSRRSRKPSPRRNQCYRQGRHMPRRTHAGSYQQEEEQWYWGVPEGGFLKFIVLTRSRLPVRWNIQPHILQCHRRWPLFQHEIAAVSLEVPQKSKSPWPTALHPWRNSLSPLPPGLICLALYDHQKQINGRHRSRRSRNHLFPPASLGIWSTWKKENWCEPPQYLWGTSYVQQMYLT